MVDDYSALVDRIAAAVQELRSDVSGPLMIVMPPGKAAWLVRNCLGRRPIVSGSGHEIGAPLMINGAKVVADLGAKDILIVSAHQPNSQCVRISLDGVSADRAVEGPPKIPTEARLRDFERYAREEHDSMTHTIADDLYYLVQVVRQLKREAGRE